MSTAYEIESDLNEKQLEADISNFLGFISTIPFQYELIAVDESITGADKRLNGLGVPIFLQFKVSQGLVPIAKYPASNRKNRSKKEGIREFRDRLDLDDRPTLYFKLRKKSKTATEYQHNILLRFHTPPSSYAMYVAPLYLERDEYSHRLFWPA